MDSWTIDPERDLRLRRVAWQDVGPVSDLARRAFDSESTGECVRRTLLVHLAAGSSDLPLERQTHVLLPTAYYLLVRGEGIGESALGLTGLYRRLWDEESEGNYWLGWFAVDPRFQGQGYGELLLRATMALCAAKGGRRLCVETAAVLQPALRLYRRLGFSGDSVVRDYWAPGADLVILHRQLDATESFGLTVPKGVQL